MKSKSPMSERLFEMMLQRGYSKEFSDLITMNLNTDFTATRMIGYLAHYSDLPEGEVVDEMLAIMSDRDLIMRKKESEAANARWNQIMWEGFEEEEE